MYINYNDYELMYLAQEGSEKAKRLLFDKYSNLIMKIFREGYYYKIYNYSDFLQEGLLILESTINSYDKSFDYSFYNYFKLCFARRVNRIKKQKGLLICETPVKYKSKDFCNFTDSKLRYLIQKEFEKESEIIKKILSECILENCSVKTFCKENNLDYRKIQYLYTKIRLKLEKILTK